MLEIVAVWINFMLDKFRRSLWKYDKFQFRKVHIYWFLFKNYNLYLLSYKGHRKRAVRQGWVGISNFFYHIATFRKTFFLLAWIELYAQDRQIEGKSHYVRLNTNVALLMSLYKCTDYVSTVLTSQKLYKLKFSSQHQEFGTFLLCNFSSLLTDRPSVACVSFV